MIYLGNYADWIQQEWIDHLMNTTGYPRPGNKQPENAFEENQNSTANNIGYKNSVYWYKFTPENFPFDVTPPIDVKPNLWWFVKMQPGNLIPLHIDQDVEAGKKTTLYWMSLTDQEDGHIFLCKNKMLTGYKKGNLYKLEHANDIHGSCNIGYTTRLIFNFTTYED